MFTRITVHIRRCRSESRRKCILCVLLRDTVFRIGPAASLSFRHKLAIDPPCSGSLYMWYIEVFSHVRAYVLRTGDRSHIAYSTHEGSVTADIVDVKDTRGSFPSRYHMRMSHDSFAVPPMPEVRYGNRTQGMSCC